MLKELEFKVEKLENENKILKHAKESDGKMIQQMKSKYEKMLQKLQNKVDLLENEIKEKETENKLNAIKLKDVLREQYQKDHQDTSANRPGWNISTSTMSQSK